MNSATFPGRVGRDAETRNTQGGDSVTSFSLANDVGYGQRKETLWIDCAIWGERGEKLAPYLKKGTPVTVIGEVKPKLFDGRDGAKAILQVTVREIELQGGRQDEQRQEPKPKQREQKRGGWEPPADLDDEIPF